MNQSHIEKKIEKIKHELMALGAMRSGSLSSQYASCQKPGCACMDPVNPKKHGPFYQLSYSFEGQSTTRFVAAQWPRSRRSWLPTNAFESSPRIGFRSPSPSHR